MAESYDAIVIGAGHNGLVYQCGSATHPGGGVMGVSGHNAAREILKDARR